MRPMTFIDGVWNDAQYAHAGRAPGPCLARSRTARWWPAFSRLGRSGPVARVVVPLQNVLSVYGRA